MLKPAKLIQGLIMSSLQHPGRSCNTLHVLGMPGTLDCMQQCLLRLETMHGVICLIKRRNDSMLHIQIRKKLHLLQSLKPYHGIHQPAEYSVVMQSAD